MFLLIGLIAAGAFFGITAAYNYQVDRWGIFTSDFETFQGRVRPNRHWLKTEYLVTEKPNIDCILFGSSRVAAIDTRKLTGSCYNFTHSGGLPDNHLAALKLFLDKGLKLRRVYLGLDDISYQWDPYESKSHHLRRAYPRGLFEWLDAQLFYLLKPIELKFLSLAAGNSRRFPQADHIIDPVLGWQDIEQESRLFMIDPEGQDEIFRTLRGTMEADFYYGAAATRAVRRFLALARSRNIEVVLFFNPLHYKSYLVRDYRRLLDFKTRISKLNPFYDFTGFNAFSVDNRYWKETSHYTTLVGDRMAEVMTGEAPIESGFGRSVNSTNLLRLEQQQLVSDNDYLFPLMKREGLIRIPKRFALLLRDTDALSSARIIQPPDRDSDALVNGGDMALRRGDPEADFRPGVWTRLPQDKYFLLGFTVDNATGDTMSFGTRQDESIDGKSWRLHHFTGKKGINRGYLGGYTTRKNPPMRLYLRNRDLNLSWQPWQLSTIRPKNAEPAVRLRKNDT
ncbi:MAG: hypothetical protein ACJAYC_002446 [Halieaceae bacterium]|jgi:hypothetical protein